MYKLQLLTHKWGNVSGISHSHLLLNMQCTQPGWSSLQVVGPHRGGFLKSLQAWPVWAPGAKPRPPGTPWQVKTGKSIYRLTSVLNHTHTLKGNTSDAVGFQCLAQEHFDMEQNSKESNCQLSHYRNNSPNHFSTAAPTRNNMKFHNCAVLNVFWTFTPYTFHQAISEASEIFIVWRRHTVFRNILNDFILVYFTCWWTYFLSI